MFVITVLKNSTK